MSKLFVNVLILFLIQFFKQLFQEYYQSEIDSIQMSTVALSGLIWAQTFCKGRDFPRVDVGMKLAHSQFKNEQKLPKIVYIIPNFLVLHFGENFMKV